jgi:hypothetical protein
MAPPEVIAMKRRSFLHMVVGSVMVVLWGCGSAAPSTSTAASASVAAPSEAPSTAPSQAEPSSNDASSAPSSQPAPSINLPSEAKDLEALLPDKLCGETATKASVAGASIASSAGKEFLTGLAALGKSASDVTFAFAFAPSGCGAGIFRIAGVDQSTLQTAMLAAVQGSGQTYAQSSLAGKTVFTDSSGSGKQYIYFHGDALIFATAPDDTKATEILQSLP